MPVHAYLRADGDRILIRPAHPEASTDTSRAAITVEGSLITGPATVLSGQSLAIGAIQLKLQRNRPKREGLWSHKWIRLVSYSILGAAALLALAFGYVRYIVLSDDSLRQMVQDAVHETLGRPAEDVEIDRFDVHFWAGQVDVSNMRIKERLDFQTSSPYFVQIPSLVVKLDAWAFITSWKRDVRNLEITIKEDPSGRVPEIALERSKLDGSLNIDDMLQKSNGMQGGKLPFSHLNFLLKVNSAVVRLRDPFNNIGETSLEKIELALRMKGAGQPIEIEKCEMQISAQPVPPKQGTLSVSGRFGVIDEMCAIDPSKLSVESLAIEMGNFDLARVFEHFGYAWEPHGANFKVVLGKPINGNVKIDAPSPRDITLSGRINSDSLVSIKEDGQPSFGNISSKLQCGELHLVKEDKEGASFVPKKVDLKLESWTNPARSEPAFLTLRSQGQLNPNNGTSQYLVELNCGLQQLLNTDVGQRLKLDGSLGGSLTGCADLIVDAKKGLRIVAKFAGQDTFVMVPEEAKKPTDPARMVKQPLPLSFECIGTAQRDENGELDYVDVAQFSLLASSFAARSETASRIEFKQKDDRMAAEAKFKLDLHGREFCREFWPILSLFGFKKPLEEDFALEVMVHGKKHVIGMHAAGTASRQWNPDPAPVKLELIVYYNKLMRETLDPKLLGALPYLSLTVHTFSGGEKRLDVNVEANCTRRDGCEAIELVHLDINGKETGEPGVKIDADIAAFSDRFRPYIETFLKQDANGKLSNELLALYTDSILTGSIHQEGRVKIKRVSSETQNATDHVEFSFNTLAGFKAVLRGKPGEITTSGRGEWSEPKLSFDLAGSYEQCLNANPEEPDKLRLLNLDRLKVEGSLGKFAVSVRDLDLLALPGLRTAANKTWTDALAGMDISGTISPEAVVLLKSLRILDPADPVSGTLDLEVAFDRSRDALDLKRFDFHQNGGFYVTALNASGTLAKVRGISARLFPTQPNNSTLAERAFGWLDESGPSAFFDHLGKEFTIHALEVDAKPFREWLVRTFNGAGDARKVPTLFAGIIERTWEPQGVWHADQVQLARDPNYPDTWRLNGVFRSDLKVRLSSSEEASAPVVTLSNPWKVELGLSLSKDSAAAIHGNVVFDESSFRASIPALKFEFEKPAKEPFKVELEGCASTRGVLPTSIGKLTATGKFGEFIVNNFVTPPNGAGAQFSAEKFSIKSAALECSGSIPAFDLKGDRLEARVESPSFELAALPEMWLLAPQSAGGTGRLKNISFSYNGGMAALMGSMSPKLWFKFDANDPRRFGLQPGSDALELEGDLEGVHIVVSKESAVEFAGRVRVSAAEIACKNFTAELHRIVPNVATGGTMVYKDQRISIPKLRVKSADPKFNLRQAAAAQGLPLEISGDVECEKPVTRAHLAVLRSALKAIAPDGPQMGAMDWPAVSKLFLTVGIKAPCLCFEPFDAANFDARNAIFKDLKLTIPMLTTSFIGGRLKLEDAEYDFSKVAARTGITGDALSQITGLRHSQRVSFTDGDLCTLLGGEKPDPVRYAVCGKFGAQGPFGGIDFNGMDRLSWNGALRFDIQNFSIGAPIAPTGGAVPSLPWMDYFKHHAAGRSTVLARASLAESVSPVEMSMTASGSASNTATVFDGFLACVELYFAKVYGVESARWEFESFSPTVRIDKGLAAFEPFELKGKGACVGFDIQIRNLKLSLADESFADEVLIYPMALPIDAQERLSLQKWPATTRDVFLTAMRAGRMPLRISGPLSAPSIKFPWAETRAVARLTLFGVEAITDVDSLAKARENLLRVWGKEDASLDAAASLADRHGVGLPGTLSSRLAKETIVDRAVKLPPKLMEAAAMSVGDRPKGPLLSPLESLKILLYAEPEPPPPPPPPPVPVTDPANPLTPNPVKPAPAPEKQPAPDKNATPPKNGNP